MYNKILVTGASGFIGKNLMQFLKSMDMKIYTYTRENSIDDLDKLLKKVDFIFHLAGEVKPKSNKDAFMSSNFILTKNLIEKIEQLGLKIPIVMTSSIHALNPQNDYGITKQEAEEILLSYHKDYAVPVYIYRLPHLFGEQCKPNYNSVISTWIYNSVHDIDIVIYDRSIPITYVYVQDFISTVIKHLEKDTEEIYCEVNEKYETTLGEVSDLINDFHQYINDDSYSFGTDEFETKLLHTYKDYYARK